MRNSNCVVQVKLFALQQHHGIALLSSSYFTVFWLSLQVFVYKELLNYSYGYTCKVLGQYVSKKRQMIYSSNFAPTLGAPTGGGEYGPSVYLFLLYALALWFKFLPYYLFLTPPSLLHYIIYNMCIMCALRWISLFSQDTITKGKFIGWCILRPTKIRYTSLLT